MELGFIGSGNVAFHLASYFNNKKIIIKWIYGRNSTTVNELAYCVNSLPQIQLTDLPSVDAIIVCVADNAIASVVEQLPCNASILITSGTFDIDTIAIYTPNSGILYPLQTFTKNTPLEINKIPFIIESRTKTITSTLNKLIDLGDLKSIQMNYEKRKKIHLSAVFLNNFINHMIHLIQEKSNIENIDFQIFNPLISETIRKALNEQAKLMQTGPAIRKDTQTIVAHQQMLDGYLFQLYNLFTNSILETHKEN